MGEDKYRPFSVRQGIKQSKAIQLESMDDDLRNRLWNEFDRCFPASAPRLNMPRHEMSKIIWTDFLKHSVDEYSAYYQTSHSHGAIKNVFLLGSRDEVFDLIEFVIRCLSVHKKLSLEKTFIEQCNIVLEEENSAYRIVGRLVTPITSQEEIKSIEAAMVTRYASANEHIRKALYYLSRRKNPDYANSIKESISAVESIAKEITGKEKSLKALTHGLNLHSKFETGLDALYDWTSTDGGMRHGATDKSLKPDQSTARFMLIICSAFVHYIIAKNPTIPKSGTKRT